MFTGIVEELGKIRQITSNNLIANCTIVTDDTKIGDSIAVNGVCLTVTEICSGGFKANISQETLSVTALGKLKSGDYINLERALNVNGRFGGHIVSGHIDGCGEFISAVKTGECYDLKIKLQPEQTKYIVKKGSICVNGISLTVADIDGNLIRCAIIPHTYENTNIKFLNRGDFVNIEVDILAKYVEKFLSTGDNKTEISMEFLQTNGFM